MDTWENLIYFNVTYSYSFYFLVSYVLFHFCVFYVIYVFREKRNTMEDYFHKKSTTPCTPQEAAILTDSVLSMIVKDMRPLAIVEGEGFKEMLTTFKSEYTLPSRRCFTNMMERKYETSLKKLKNKLKMATSKISLSTDAWTSLVTEA